MEMLNGSDMLRIIKDGKEIYAGYLGLMRIDSLAEKETINNATVEQFRAVPEIRHRQWREKGLAAPLLPDELPQYKFSDLMMTLYYTIYIAKGK